MTKMKDFKDNPDWNDAQHAYHHAIFMLENSPDEDDIIHIKELLEMIGEP